jgi:hypothetical protein
MTMKEMTANDDSERCGTGAAKYAAYLETPEGRLRLDLAFANLQDFLHSPHGLCSLWILGAAPAPSQCDWRDLVFTSPCWMRLSQCWISRSVRHEKQELRRGLRRNTAMPPNLHTCSPPGRLM